MGNFNQGGFRRDFGGQPARKFKAVCAECQQSCEVPFEPKPGGRPVYCGACWSKRRNNY
ncbi:DNA-directed RNA polymerase [Candidatus Woesearchaeota archaeon]|nr:DNA-directed RNA polymerase [Candidatus Woesearchaeota archaeon]